MSRCRCREATKLSRTQLCHKIPTCLPSVQSWRQNYDLHLAEVFARADKQTTNLIPFCGNSILGIEKILFSFLLAHISEILQNRKENCNALFEASDGKKQKLQLITYIEFNSEKCSNCEMCSNLIHLPYVSNPDSRVFWIRIQGL